MTITTVQQTYTDLFNQSSADQGFLKKYFINPPLGHGYASCQSAPSPALCFTTETPNVTVSTLKEGSAKRSKWAKEKKGEKKN